MAEPLDPNTPGAPGAPGGGNGGNNNIDREMTPLASKQKMNAAALGGLALAGMMFIMWWAGAFSTEQPPPAPKTETVQTQETPPLPLPTPPTPPAPAYTPPTPPPVDLMDAERERLLLLKVRGLQKQMFERRRSPMLVVSAPARHNPRPRAGR